MNENMTNHSAEDCNINDQVHVTPPEVDCGHDVMEGPGLDASGAVRSNPDSQVIRKDAASTGPGMKDGKPLPPAEGKVIRKDSAAGGPAAE